MTDEKMKKNPETHTKNYKSLKLKKELKLQQRRNSDLQKQWNRLNSVYQQIQRFESSEQHNVADLEQMNANECDPT